uniref:Rab11 family-interacting protein 5 n=1 Tax=Pan troglodytes TaxID=9598 RepID=G2HFH3_PANTR|nr:rab11 family-interacting protein 5 [Pan troglodytes]
MCRSWRATSTGCWCGSWRPHPRCCRSPRAPPNSLPHPTPRRVGMDLLLPALSPPELSHLQWGIVCLALSLLAPLPPASTAAAGRGTSGFPLEASGSVHNLCVFGSPGSFPPACFHTPQLWGPQGIGTLPPRQSRGEL